MTTEEKAKADERIRKWLIDTIKSIPNDSIEWDVIDKSRVLDWLDKQGESDETKAKIFLINKGYPINAEKLKSEIERRRLSNRYIDTEGYENELLEIIDSLQQELPVVDLKNYISNRLHKLGADLINHKLYSFNRGLNVGQTDAYQDILDKLNTRKEE